MRRARWNGNNVFPSQPRYAQAFNCPRETTSGTNLHNYASLNFAASLLIINGAFSSMRKLTFENTFGFIEDLVLASLRTERDRSTINRAFEDSFGKKIQICREIEVKICYWNVCKDDEERSHERELHLYDTNLVYIVLNFSHAIVRILARARFNFILSLYRKLHQNLTRYNRKFWEIKFGSRRSQIF